MIPAGRGQHFGRPLSSSSPRKAADIYILGLSLSAEQSLTDKYHIYNHALYSQYNGSLSVVRGPA